MARRLALVLALLALLLPAESSAHGLRTAYVEIVEVTPGRATAHLKVTGNDPSLTLVAGGSCSLADAGDGTEPGGRAWMLVCPAGLSDGWIELRGLGPIVSDAVLWESFADGTTTSRVLTAASERVPLRPVSGPLEVARQYAVRGVDHILTGYDHLLFLLLLTLLVRSVRGVMLAETAFTLSHSLSFSATSLGWVRVSPLATETCIALSLLLLAADVDPSGGSVSPRKAALMALVFGLVHGLGFAGGLREIGLPEQAVGAALVAFGVGVEIGQVAFLALALLAFHVVRRFRWSSKLEWGAVYAAGGLSAYWVLARGAALILAR